MILIDIKDLYSLPFDCPVSEIPYIYMVKEIDDCHDWEKPKFIQSKYYKYLVNLLEKEGIVWGWIKSLNDCMKRTSEFYRLIEHIKYGYRCENEITYQKKLPYGKLTIIKKDSKTYLVDGHHRISILIYLGITKFKISDCGVYLTPVYE